jgi:hypothetical protein
LIAQGLLLYLAVRFRQVSWYCANHYLRTANPHQPPSEWVVQHALRNTWSDFLRFSPLAVHLKKFLAPQLTPHYYSRLELWEPDNAA